MSLCLRRRVCVCVCVYVDVRMLDCTIDVYERAHVQGRVAERVRGQGGCWGIREAGACFRRCLGECRMVHLRVWACMCAHRL